MTKGRISPQKKLQSQTQNLGGNCLGQTPLCKWENRNVLLRAELGAYSLSGSQTLKVVLRLPPSSTLHLLLPPSPCKLLKTEMPYKRVYRSPGSLRVHAGTPH